MNAIKSLALVVGISVLYFGMIVEGYLFGGAGHGSLYFAAALIAPFSTSEGMTGLWPLGFVVWPTVGVLLAFRRFRSCTMAAAAVLVLHYLGVVVLSLHTDWYYVGKVWDAMPSELAALVAIYLGSQVFMWVLIARKPRRADPTGS